MSTRVDWSRRRTFWIVVAVIVGLVVLLNILSMTFAAGESGLDVGPIETKK